MTLPGTPTECASRAQAANVMTARLLVHDVVVVVVDVVVVVTSSLWLASVSVVVVIVTFMFGRWVMFDTLVGHRLFVVVVVVVDVVDRLCCYRRRRVERSIRQLFVVMVATLWKQWCSLVCL